MTDWYKKLLSMHGHRLSIGAVPHSAEATYWIMSPQEEMASHAEHVQFCQELEAAVVKFSSRVVPELDPWLLSVCDDYFGIRSVCIAADMGVLQLSVADLARLLLDIQAVLHTWPLWRVGFFAAESVIVYGNAVFVGQVRIAVGECNDALAAWLQSQIDASSCW